MKDLKNIIERAWTDRRLLQENDVLEAIRYLVSLLDKGEIRVA